MDGTCGDPSGSCRSRRVRWWPWAAARVPARRSPSRMLRTAARRAPRVL